MATTCQRCGKCCERFNLSMTRKELHKRYREWRAGKMKPGVDYGDIHILALMVRTVEVLDDGKQEMMRCVHFSRDNKGRGVCAIRFARPLVCKNFPLYGQKYKHIGKRRFHEGCTYLSTWKKVQASKLRGAATHSVVVEDKPVPLIDVEPTGKPRKIVSRPKPLPSRGWIRPVEAKEPTHDVSVECVEEKGGKEKRWKKHQEELDVPQPSKDGVVQRTPDKRLRRPQSDEPANRHDAVRTHHRVSQAVQHRRRAH